MRPAPSQAECGPRTEKHCWRPTFRRQARQPHHRASQTHPNQSRLWNNLLDQGELEAADDHLGRALELQQQLGDQHRQANTLLLLSRVAMRRGEFAKACSDLIDALRFAQRFDNRATEGQIWNALADLAVEQGEPSASAQLRATGVLLLRTVHTAKAASVAAAGYQKLQELARLEAAAKDADALLALAEDSYRRDRGWGAVKAAFGPLDDPDQQPAGR